MKEWNRKNVLWMVLYAVLYAVATAIVEEMPAGYADSLMAASPAWALVAVIIAGIVFSVIISNATAKLFKLDK